MKLFALKLLTPFLVFLLVLQSCKKEWKEEITDQDSQLIQNFFKVFPGTSPEVSMIANNWSRQKGFKEQLSAFVKKNGHPIWDKAFVQISNSNDSKIKSKLESDSSSSSSGVVFIPLKDQVSNEIKSYVVCNKHADSVYSYRLYNKDEISNIDATNNDTLGRVRNITLSMFAYFEKEINNKENIYIGGKTKQTINKIKISAALQSGNTGNKGQRINTYYCGTSFSFTTAEVYTDAITGNTVVQFNVTTVFVVCAETLSGWDPSNAGIPGSLSGGMPGTGDIFVFTGGGSSGNGSVSSAPNGWWNYGAGYNGIYIPGTFNDPSNLYSYFNGPAEVVSSTDEQLMLQNLAFQLNLGVEEQWFLLSNLNMVGALYDYFANGSQSVTEKIAILKEHINALVSNPDYSIFVQKYTLLDNSGKVWWENDSWVESNIKVNVNGCFPTPCDFKILNAEEKIFCKKYPVSMFFIANNRQAALIATNQEYGLPANNTLIHPNNKSNAFIHALFCALNSNNPFIGEERARLFAEAHESDTPPQFQIESVMDDHNNEVGINIGINNSLAFIIYKIREAMSMGYLRYLFPLNMSDGCFWGCIINPIGTHGIDSNTRLIPTNQ